MTNVLDESKYHRAFAELFGDEASGSSSYVRLWNRLLVYLSKEGVADIDLEDLADDVMDRLFAKRSGGEDIKNVTAFALAVAKNVVREYRKRYWKTQLIPLSQFPDEAPDAARFLSLPSPHELYETEAEASQHFKLIENCLRELTPAEWTLLCQYYEGSYASREKIAADMGISLETLRVRMFRLKLRLRERYQHRLQTAQQLSVNVEGS